MNLNERKEICVEWKRKCKYGLLDYFDIEMIIYVHEIFVTISVPSLAVVHQYEEVQVGVWEAGSHHPYAQKVPLSDPKDCHHPRTTTLRLVSPDLSPLACRGMNQWLKDGPDRLSM